MDKDLAVPPLLADRVRRYRARLGPHAKRVGQGETILPDSRTDMVLAVAALPEEQAEIVAWLENARAVLAGAATIRIIDSSRPPKRSSPGERVRNRGNHRSNERDVPAAVRASGWTIASIERIDVERDDRVPELWVDLLAMDFGSRA